MGSRRSTSKRVFGEISRLPSGRYRARYTGPDRNRHSAPVTFVARIDAEGWLVEQERLISRGEWRPPGRQVRGSAPTHRTRSWADPGAFSPDHEHLTIRCGRPAGLQHSPGPPLSCCRPSSVHGFDRP